MFLDAESSLKTHSSLSQPAISAAVAVPEFGGSVAPTAQIPSLAPPNGAPSQQTHPLAPPASAWPHSGAVGSGAPGMVSVAGVGMGAGPGTGSAREQLSSRSAVEFAGGNKRLPDITRKYHLKVWRRLHCVSTWLATWIIWRKNQQWLSWCARARVAHLPQGAAQHARWSSRYPKGAERRARWNPALESSCMYSSVWVLALMLKKLP